MPINFCVFTDIQGQQVAMNPEYVRCIRPVSADATRIEFDGSHTVTVKANLIDVARGLRTGEGERRR
jgi:hypothetical protein